MLLTLTRNVTLRLPLMLLLMPIRLVSDISLWESVTISRSVFMTVGRIVILFLPILISLNSKRNC